jgi:hypothetical protein
MEPHVGICDVDLIFLLEIFVVNTQFDSKYNCSLQIEQQLINFRRINECVSKLTNRNSFSCFSGTQCFFLFIVNTTCYVYTIKRDLYLV